MFILINTYSVVGGWSTTGWSSVGIHLSVVVCLYNVSYTPAHGDEERVERRTDRRCSCRTLNVGLSQNDNYLVISRTS